MDRGMDDKSGLPEGIPPAMLLYGRLPQEWPKGWTRLLTSVQLFRRKANLGISSCSGLCTIAMIAFTLHVISRSYQKPEGTSTVFLPSKCVSYQNYSHYIARTRLISAHIQMKTAVARCGASCTVEKHGFGSLFEIYSEFTVQWQRVHSLLHQSAQGTSRTALVCIMQ
jgi:hypothetical protein